MINPWVILAVVLAFVGNGFYWHHSGYAAATTEWTVKIEKERATAAQAARQQEREQQEIVNEALRQQNEELAGVNAVLRNDLDGLRKRPERPPGNPAAGRAACAGGTGAELSRADAEFLVWEASRADSLRAGLKACYQVIDALQ